MYKIKQSPKPKTRKITIGNALFLDAITIPPEYIGECLFTGKKLARADGKSSSYQRQLPFSGTSYYHFFYHAASWLGGLDERHGVSKRVIWFLQYNKVLRFSKPNWLPAFAVERYNTIQQMTSGLPDFAKEQVLDLMSMAGTVQERNKTWRRRLKQIKLLRKQYVVPMDNYSNG